MTNPTRLALAHAAGKLHIKDGGDPFAVLSQKITGMADAMKKRGDDLETKFSEVTEQQPTVALSVCRSRPLAAAQHLLGLWASRHAVCLR